MRGLLVCTVLAVTFVPGVAAAQETPEQLTSIARSGICPADLRTVNLLTYAECGSVQDARRCAEQYEPGGPSYLECTRPTAECRRNVQRANVAIGEYNNFIFKCRQAPKSTNGAAAKPFSRPDPASSSNLSEELAKRQEAQEADNQLQRETARQWEKGSEERRRAAQEQIEREHALQQQRLRPEQKVQQTRREAERSQQEPKQSENQVQTGPWYVSEYCSRGVEEIEAGILGGAGCGYCFGGSHLGARHGDCSTEAGQREAVQVCGPIFGLDSYRRGPGGNCSGQ